MVVKRRGARHRDMCGGGKGARERFAYVILLWHDLEKFGESVSADFTLCELKSEFKGLYKSSIKCERVRITCD